METEVENRYYDVRATEKDDRDDLGIYSSSRRERMVDDDEITPEDYWFMDGYDDAYGDEATT